MEIKFLIHGVFTQCSHNVQAMLLQCCSNIENYVIFNVSITLLQHYLNTVVWLNFNAGHQLSYNVRKHDYELAQIEVNFPPPCFVTIDKIESDGVVSIFTLK